MKENENSSLDLENDNEIARLQAEKDMLAKIIVGGLLGAYLQEGFPLYYISDTMLSYLGFSSKQEFSDACGGLIANQMHPDDRQSVWQSVQEQIRTGDEYVVEYRYRKKDGTYLWVHDAGKIVVAENGKTATTSICYDITAQKKLQQQLQETSHEMQTIMDNIPGGVVKIGLKDGKIVPIYVSTGWCKMLGDSPENIARLYADNAMNGVHPDDYDRVENIFKTAMQTGQPINSVYRLANSRGEYRWVNNRSSLVSDENGQVNYFAVYTDVTDEMTAKQHAEQANREMELLYNSIPGAVFKCRFNADWDVIFANDGLFRFIGYTREEFQTLFHNKMSGVIYPDDGAIMVGKIAKQLEHGTTVKNENRLICKDGSIKWISIHADLLTDEAGEQYFYCTFVDITEQKQAELELEQTQQELSTLIYNVPGGVFKYSYITDDFGYISPYMLSMLGYTSEEFAEKFSNKFSNMIYVEDRQRAIDEINVQIAVGDTDHCEYRVETKSGELKWFYDAGYLIGRNTENPTYYVVIVDITDKKKAELAFSQAQKKLTAAITHAGLAYWEYDVKNHLAHLNDVSIAEYKLTRVLENYPQSVYDSGAIVPESVAAYQGLIDAVNAGKPSVMADIKTIDADGKAVWKRVRFTTLFDEKNRPCWAVATAETIDEFKSLEQQFAITAAQTGIESWIYDIGSRTIIRTATTDKDYGVESVISNIPDSLLETGAIHKDDAAAVHEMYHKIESGEKAVSAKARMFRPDLGEYVYHQISYTVLFDKRGNPIRAIGTGVDISKQMDLEKQYREALDGYRNVPKENVLLSAYCNITHNQLLGMTSRDNADYIAMYGDDRDAFFTRLSKIVKGDDKKREVLDKFLTEPLIRAYAKGIARQSVKCKILVHGTYYRYVELTIEVLKKPGTEELVGFFNMYDITKETVYKKAVTVGFQKYSDFLVDVDVRQDVYTMLTMRDDLTNIPPLSGVFSKINEEYAKTFADEESERECIEKLSYTYALAHLKTEDSYWFYYRIHEHGALRTKKIQVFYVDKELEHIGFVRVDVTETLAEEQKKNEALAHALTSSERANRAKTDFLSRMSHDIRTPMNAIIGMTELTKREIDDKEKALENLSVIDSSSKLLLRMINNVLDMSQIESGNMVLAKETFDCQKECQNVVEMTAVMFAQKKQTLVTEKNMQHQFFVGDVVRLKRVLINLLNNASKFSPKGGQIKLTASEETNLNPQLTTLVFAVSDNGIGIAKDKLDSIFKPFEQLETEEKYLGTGLGLPIVKSIVEAKGGTVSVDSEVGKGSTFTVRLPLRLAEGIQAENAQYPEKATKSATADVNFSNLRVLLVEDHPINTMVAKRLLEKFGAKVDTAENGAIGYDKLVGSKAETYNIIFMDIQMPVMNGYEAARAIRQSAHPQAKSIPILAMTANAFTQDIQKSLESGMNGHIAKPISIETIAAAVNNVMTI